MAVGDAAGATAAPGVDYVSGPIVFERVGKRFRTGRHHGSLRELFAAWARRNGRQPASDEFWALRDVSLDIVPGAALGLIGPNGAGKSTVLKLLTGILQPTEGRVEVPGRVGALIELAAGFHPDLTGRENVYLQGAIMGMKRGDVAQRFDAIVAFAGVETFIDTPVKRYSNGMIARLGFAIAAHLDPDLLLIDEVLSVGDRAFQQRAIEHVRQTIARGVPVVLVSHHLELVAQLCHRAVLLSAGQVIQAGPADECVAHYVRAVDDTSDTLKDPAPVRIAAVTTQPSGRVAPGTQVVVRVEGEVTDPSAAEKPVVVLRVWSLPSEELLFVTNTRRAGLRLPAAGKFTLEFTLQLHLGAGLYRLQALVFSVEREKDWSRAAPVLITVDESPLFGGRVDLQPGIRLVDPR
jgi:ABC-type polysaccharide/polyol phosphate transport system ATPase subunit